jgi:uncharacterized membrane protein
MTHQGVRDLDNPPRTHSNRSGGGQVNVGSTERAFSTLGGAALAGFGLARGDIVGLCLAALGGSLVYRGMTGHCSAYTALGVNTAR